MITYSACDGRLEAYFRRGNTSVLWTSSAAGLDRVLYPRFAATPDVSLPTNGTAILGLEMVDLDGDGGPLVRPVMFGGH
jgi:hypothetical protein